MTWQPDAVNTGDEAPADLPGPAGAESPEYVAPGGPPTRARGRSWAAIVALLAVGLCGLAGGAAGAVRQLLPREFSASQQRQIQTWEMTRRWRAMQAGQIFPATISYPVSPQDLNGVQGLVLTATRLALAPQSSCRGAVSAAAVTVLAAARCAAVLRATYVDASGSMAITLGVAALPDAAAAMTAAQKLARAIRDQGLAVHAFPVARTPAAGFRQAQRQFSIAVAAGPYVILATAGFTDGRRHVQLSTDDYYEQEMSSLAYGLAGNVSRRLGATPLPPTCPGAPGC